MERVAKFEEMYDFDLNGLKCMYARLFEPDTAFGQSCWKVDLILPEKLALEMKNVGFNCRQKDYGDENGEQWVITAKRKTHKRDGTPMFPPNVYDSGEGKPQPQRWDKSISIGNGSILNCRVAAQYRDVGGKTHLPLYLNDVQVAELVEYHGNPFSSIDKTTKADFPPF